MSLGTVRSSVHDARCRSPSTARRGRVANAPLPNLRSAGFAYPRGMDYADAHKFVREWLDAWNAHDVDAVLAHFAKDARFTSPVAARIVDGSDGVVRGKAALRDYWSEGLRRIPDLRFDLVGVYVGVDAIVINYRNQNGGLVNEVLKFDGQHVVEGHGTYLGEDSGPGA